MKVKVIDLVLIAVVVVVLFMFIWPLHADPLVVPNQNGGWDATPFFAELQQFCAGVLDLAIVGLLAMLLVPVNKLLGTHFESREIAKDLHMTEYADGAVAKAIAWAKQQTGLTDESLKDVQLRNPVLSLAAGFLFKQYPEVWTWVANGEKGVMQYIEAHLPASAAMPVTLVAGVGPVPATEQKK